MTQVAAPVDHVSRPGPSPGELAAVDVEQSVVDDAGGGRGARRAVAALLDHDDDHVLRVVGRRVAAYQA